MRIRLTKKANRKAFTKTAGRVNSKNCVRPMMRGGVRL